MDRRRLAALVLGATVAAGGLAACGDDDEKAAPTTAAGGGTTAVASDGAPVAAEACDAYATLTGPVMAGMVDPAEVPAAIDAFTAVAPAAIAADAAAVGAGLTAAFGGDEAAFGDPAFLAALQRTGDHLFEGCEAAAKLDVAGIDYGFDGIPAEVPAGRVAVRLTNESESHDAHELVLVRPADDAATAVELAALPVDELMGRAEMVGVVFVDEVGASATSFFDLEPGRYVAICTLPVGGEEAGGDHAGHAETHSSQGMVRQFTVV